MKIFYVLAAIVFLATLNANAQIQIKTEYIGSSVYKDENNNKTGGKGDAKIISGGINIPLSMKLNENNKPIVWAVSLGASYTSFGNKNMPESLSPPKEIMNSQLALMHMRPISKNWSILASLGAGTYTAHTDIARIGMRNVLANGGLIFIWHARNNLSLGIGPAINTVFGYPMAFPALYLNWNLSGRYEVKVSMLNAVDISAGIILNEKVKLKIVAEMNGSMALENKDGKKMMFSHQYMATGFSPEFTFGKISIPLVAGISAFRPAFYDERSLKAFFKAMSREYDPYFTISPYFSAAVRYNF